MLRFLAKTDFVDDLTTPPKWTGPLTEQVPARRRHSLAENIKEVGQNSREVAGDVI